MANPSENLIELARIAAAAEAEATSVPYTAEGWEPWREAAKTFQAAVTEEAAATGEDRFKLEMAAKKAVLQPEPDGS